jgi:surface polysaccharide O-acyltransferase-like enzyme
MYVLIGLYLLTPIFRIFIANADEKVTKYLIILWFTSVATVPLFNMLSIYQLHNDVFTLTGYVGYFVFGTYLITVKTRRQNLSSLMILGIALTVVGTYVLAATGAGTGMYFFQEYLSPTVILASVMVFMLLLTIKPPSAQKKESTSKAGKLVKLISQNTLAIYMFHVMVIETIQNGYLGFAINRNTLNPIVEIPLLTVIVLFISLAIILVLRKIPYMKELIGCAPNT